MIKQSKQTLPSRWLFLLLICAALCLLGTIVAYAAMTTEDKKVNNFQVGNLETRIDEIFTTPVSSLKPGDSHAKKVRVQNDGTIKQFIRIMVIPEIISEMAEKSGERLLPVQINKELLLDLDPEKVNSANWLDGGDGYYYYVKGLAPNEKTELLFSTVTLSKDLDNTYNEGSLFIHLRAESIMVNTAAYREAWWQGKQPTEGPLKDIDQLLQKEVE